MWKKALAILMVLVISVLVIGGCSSQKNTETNATQEVIELKLALNNPANSDVPVMFAEFAKSVAEKSQGRLKVTIYPGETLVKGADQFDAVVNGVADLSWNVSVMHPGRLPLTQLVALPMMDIPSYEAGSKAWNSFFNTTDYLKDEYKDVKVLFLQASGNSSVLGTNNKPIRTLADLKGMRIRVAPGAQTEFMKMAGALPMNIPIPEMWESMDKKVIDGYMSVYSAVDAFKWWDVTKYVTNVKFYSPMFYFVMNQKKYDSLPDDLKKVIDEASKEQNTRMDQGFDTILGTQLKMAKEKYGENFLTLSPEEEPRWREVAQKSWDIWFADKAKAGLPGKEATEAFIKLLPSSGGK